MGVDWTAIFNQGGAVISSTMGAVPVLSGVFSNGEVTVLLDALATNSSARVVTDQNIVTLSGRPAAMLAGGEFAVPTTVGVNGVGAATTTFRGYGTSVIVVPTVVDNDLFRLQIVPEISKIDSGTTVGGIPGLSVSRVQTQVELREGQTIVLGGLFGRKESASNTRIPLLGEIPIVGEFLFHTKRATEDENELILLATPEIVRAMDADQVPPLPGHYVTHPDDFDFFKYNRIEGNPDLGHYQLLPFGNGQGPAHDVGHNFYNPNPADGRVRRGHRRERCPTTGAAWSASLLGRSRDEPNAGATGFALWHADLPDLGTDAQPDACPLGETLIPVSDFSVTLHPC